MKKRLLSLLLSVLILCSAIGCTNQKSDETAPKDSYADTAGFSQTEELSENNGKYTEEAVPLTSDFETINELFLLKNRPAFADTSQKTIYVENENKERFRLQSLIKSEYLTQEQLLGISVVCSNDGDYIINYLGGEEMQDKYLYVSSDGTMKELALTNSYGYGTESLKDFEFSPENRLFAIDYDTGVYEINTKDGSKTKLFESNSYIMTFDIAGGYIITIDSEGVMLYDYRQSKLQETPEALQSFIKEQNITLGEGIKANCDFCGGEDGTLYFVSQNGLYRYVMGGNLVEQLIGGLYCSMGNPFYTINSVLQDTDGSFLVAYNEGKIMRYYFDNNSSDEIMSHLKIYSLTENDILKSTINLYKRKHPSVEIEYVVGLKSNPADLQMEMEALVHLQNEILSENPPDIIMLDGLRIDEMLKDHQLLNLADYRNDIAPAQVLLDNVTDWNQSEDGLYSMSCRFQLPVLIGSPDTIESIGNLTSFANRVEELRQKDSQGSILYILTGEEIIENALIYAGDEIISEHTLSRDALINMLQSCKKLYDNNNSIYSAGEIEDYRQSQETSAFGAAERGQFVLQGYAQLSIGTVGDFLDGIYRLESYQAADQPVAYRFGLSETDTGFLPVCTLSVCSSAKNKENAIDFLKTAFSKECQNIDSSDGFPVNRSVLETMLSGNGNPYATSMALAMNENVCQVPYQNYMTGKELDAFQSTLKALDTPIVMDAMTRDVIITVGSRYLNEELSVEAAADEIINQLKLK